MSHTLMVIAPEPADFTVTLEQFRSASEYWQPYAKFSLGGLSGSDPADATIEIDRPGEPGFLIIHFQDAVSLYTDGTEDQAAEVAVWAINTFPKTGPGEVWLVDQGLQRPYRAESRHEPGRRRQELAETQLTPSNAVRHSAARPARKQPSSQRLCGTPEAGQEMHPIRRSDGDSRRLQ